MSPKVLRRHSSSDIYESDSKENKELTITPKEKKYKNVTIRKLSDNDCCNKVSSLNKAFKRSNIPVFVDKLKHKRHVKEEIPHSQKNTAVKNITSTANVPKTRLKKSVSAEILPLVKFYEEIHHRQLNSNKDIIQFSHKRVNQLQIADNFVNEIETPLGIFNKSILCTPVKIKHRRSKAHNSKSIVNISAELFQYSDDIIQYYEQLEDKRMKLFTSFKSQIILRDEWQTSVNNIVTLAAKLHFPPALPYHAIRLMNDLFIIGALKDVPIRLLEITILWLIAKKDYLYSKLPMINEVIQNSNYFFTLNELTDCELRILLSLNFNINYSDLISIIMYNVKTYYGCNYTHANFGAYYYFGAYMLDVLLFNRIIIKKPSLLIAGIISSLTYILLNSKTDNLEIEKIDYWIPDRIKTAFPKAEKITIIENLILGIKNSFDKKFQEHVIFQKYQKSRYNKIASIMKMKFSDI